MFLAADFHPDLIPASLPVGQARGRLCVCARQGSILGGDLSPLPSCCLLLPPQLRKVIRLSQWLVGLWDFQPVPCHCAARLWHLSPCTHMGTSWAPICPVRRQVTQETVPDSLGDKCALVLSAGQNREPLPGITRIIGPGKRTILPIPRSRRLGAVCCPKWRVEGEVGG